MKASREGIGEVVSQSKYLCIFSSLGQKGYENMNPESVQGFFGGCMCTEREIGKSLNWYFTLQKVNSC